MVNRHKKIALEVQEIEQDYKSFLTRRVHLIKSSELGRQEKAKKLSEEAETLKTKIGKVLEQGVSKEQRVKLEQWITVATTLAKVAADGVSYSTTQQIYSDAEEHKKLFEALQAPNLSDESGRRKEMYERAKLLKELIERELGRDDISVEERKKFREEIEALKIRVEKFPPPSPIAKYGKLFSSPYDYQQNAIKTTEEEIKEFTKLYKELVAEEKKLTVEEIKAKVEEMQKIFHDVIPTLNNVSTEGGDFEFAQEIKRRQTILAEQLQQAELAAKKKIAEKVEVKRVEEHSRQTSEEILLHKPKGKQPRPGPVVEAVGGKTLKELSMPEGKYLKSLRETRELLLKDNRYKGKEISELVPDEDEKCYTVTYTDKASKEEKPNQVELRFYSNKVELSKFDEEAFTIAVTMLVEACWPIKDYDIKHVEGHEKEAQDILTRVKDAVAARPTQTSELGITAEPTSDPSPRHRG